MVPQGRRNVWGHKDWSSPCFQDSVNPIWTRGADYAHHSTTVLTMLKYVPAALSSTLLPLRSIKMAPKQTQLDLNPCVWTQLINLADNCQICDNSFYVVGSWKIFTSEFNSDPLLGLGWIIVSTTWPRYSLSSDRYSSGFFLFWGL